MPADPALTARLIEAAALSARDCRYPDMRAGRPWRDEWERAHWVHVATHAIAAAVREALLSGFTAKVAADDVERIWPNSPLVPLLRALAEIADG